MGGLAHSKHPRKGVMTSLSRDDESQGAAQQQCVIVLVSRKLSTQPFHWLA